MRWEERRGRKDFLPNWPLLCSWLAKSSVPSSRFKTWKKNFWGFTVSDSHFQGLWDFLVSGTGISSSSFFFLPSICCISAARWKQEVPKCAGQLDLFELFSPSYEIHLLDTEQKSCKKTISPGGKWRGELYKNTFEKIISWKSGSSFSSYIQTCLLLRGTACFSLSSTLL